MPKWKDSRLSFKHVYVSRRPSDGIAKGSDGAVGHMAAVGYDVSNYPAYHHVRDEDDELEANSQLVAFPFFFEFLITITTT